MLTFEFHNLIAFWKFGVALVLITPQRFNASTFLSGPKQKGSIVRVWPGWFYIKIAQTVHLEIPKNNPVTSTLSWELYYFRTELKRVLNNRWGLNLQWYMNGTALQQILPHEQEKVFTEVSKCSNLLLLLGSVVLRLLDRICVNDLLRIRSAKKLELSRTKVFADIKFSFDLLTGTGFQTFA